MPVNLPAIAEEAREIVARLENHRHFEQFKTASLAYSEDWQCFTDYPSSPTGPWRPTPDRCSSRGLRALGLKALTGTATADGTTAEPPIAVDEMTHAVIAQAQLLHTQGLGPGIVRTRAVSGAHAVRVAGSSAMTS